LVRLRAALGHIVANRRGGGSFARSIAPIARALQEERYRVVRFDEGLRLAAPLQPLIRGLACHHQQEQGEASQ